MQRVVCRFFRGNLRNRPQTSECPTLANEEVKKKQRQEEEQKTDNLKGSRTPLNEAILWTGGLLLSYHVTHHRRKPDFCGFTAQEKLQYGLTQRGLTSNNCLLTLLGPFKAYGQPQVLPPPLPSSNTTVSRVKARKTTPSILTKKPNSIDKTPFLKEPLLFPPALDYDSGSEVGGSCASTTYYSDDDEIEEDDILFLKEEKEMPLNQFPFRPSTKPSDEKILASANKFSGDLLSILGAFKFLTFFQKKNKAVEDEGKPSKAVKTIDFNEPPVTAMELLEKGSELGSSRALYNMGVAYERLNESSIARDYFKRAADLGHPLASFNMGILKIRDGRLAEGIQFMNYAAKQGVKEANAYIKAAPQEADPSQINPTTPMA